MASLRRDPPESEAVVGLLLVALSSDRGVAIFHWALGDRPAVPQVCAFAAERPSTNSRPGADGAARGRKHSAGADVLDGCERKDDGIERVRNRDWCVETHCGVGYDDSQDEHPADCIYRRA